MFEMIQGFFNFNSLVGLTITIVEQNSDLLFLFPNLKTLNLKFDHEHEFIFIIPLLENLEELKISGTCQRFDPINIPKMKKLRKLKHYDRYNQNPITNLTEIDSLEHDYEICHFENTKIRKLKIHCHCDLFSQNKNIEKLVIKCSTYVWIKTLSKNTVRYFYDFLELNSDGNPEEELKKFINLKQIKILCLKNLVNPKKMMKIDQNISRNNIFCGIKLKIEYG